MSQALGDRAEDEDEEKDSEDTVNEALEQRMASRKMLTNASYFAFTATPKNKTLEMFGEPLQPDAEGKIKHQPFHSYTMKQAVEEGFILDVLKTYTPVDSYYKLIKKIEGDPEFDTSKAKKKLRRYVESHDHAIRLKAEIMVDHFHEQVLAAGKIGGQARAMVVTSGIERAIQYFHAFKTYLVERNSPYQAIVAFSGEHDYGGARVSEVSLNGFSSRDIAARIQTDPYRFLICADKFQTGYDEPLLHTMYVDKPLSGIKAVQTLSRLNRAHPQKHDCFVLDFQNNSEAIILEAIDMDSYRVEKKAMLKIALADSDAEIEPVPTDAAARKGEPELDRLSNILKTFNEQFGTLFTDTDRVAKRIRDDIAPKVAADAAYQNAKENTPHTARMAHDQALGKVMQHLLKDDTQVYKQFVENESFKRFVGDMVYAITNQG